LIVSMPVLDSVNGVGVVLPLPFVVLPSAAISPLAAIY